MKPPVMTEAHRDVFRQAEVHSFTAREAEFAHEKMRDIRDNIASQVRGDSILVERAEVELLANASTLQTGEIQARLSGWLSSSSPTTGKSE